MKAILKQYYSMHKSMYKETQFNRKVELNIKISKFKKDNNIELIDKSGAYYIVTIGGEPMGEIYPIKDDFNNIIKYKYK